MTRHIGEGFIDSDEFIRTVDGKKYMEALKLYSDASGAATQQLISELRRAGKERKPGSSIISVRIECEGE